MTTSDVSPEQTEQKLAGIRGWLILPAIGLAVSPILGVIGLLAGIASLERMIDRGYGAYSFMSLLVNLGILIYIFIAGARFFKKRKDAPQTVIHLMIARVVASVLLFIVGLAVIGGGDELVMLSLLKSNNFIAQGIAAAIWIPYFKRSKRVKATFVS